MWSVTALNVSPPGAAENSIAAPETRALVASVTVAVAVVVVVPLATIDIGASLTVTVVAGPAAADGDA